MGLRERVMGGVAAVAAGWLLAAPAVAATATAGVAAEVVSPQDAWRVGIGSDGRLRAGGQVVPGPGADEADHGEAGPGASWRVVAPQPQPAGERRELVLDHH